MIANVREVDAPLMRKGAAVEVRVLAFPGRVFKAKLAYVAPSIDPNTRRLAVRAEIDNRERGAQAGDVRELQHRHRRESESAGRAAAGHRLRRRQRPRLGGAQGDSLGLRQIRTGRSRDGMVEVLAGLKPGEKVVTSGTLFIDRAAKEGD